jgi:hypothetical protein
MNRYIGVKEIHATPMNRADYNELRGWELPADENGEDEGYMVEYLDGGKANHPDFQGYISWSPADVFERAYKPVEGMTFGFALECLKKGFKLARKGWNGQGMFIYWVSAGAYPPKMPVAQEYFDGKAVPYRDYIAMKTVNDEVVPWVASQSDMLCNDWRICE